MSAAEGLLVEEADAMAGRVILLRRVSGRPGAEGAPFEGRAALCCWRVLVLEVESAKPAAGVMRRDCKMLLVIYPVDRTDLVRFN